MDKNLGDKYRINSLSPEKNKIHLEKTNKKPLIRIHRIQSKYFQPIMERPEQYLQNSTSFDEHPLASQYQYPANNFPDCTKNENIMKKDSSLSSTLQKIAEGGQKIDDEREKINFAQQYRENLRRTVFNQTKMMIKNKKRNLKLSFQTLQPVRKKYLEDSDTEKSDQLQKNNQAYNKKKLVLHSHRPRHNSQKINPNIDTMYRTIITIDKSDKDSGFCHQLDVARFPLIMRNKNQVNYNYSNLLTTLNMKKKVSLTHEDEKKNQARKYYFEQKKMRKRQEIEVKGATQKHDIRPWQTFTDQFCD